MSSRTIEILLVEDNPGDVRLTLEAFKEGRVLNNFTVMSDGVEALAYLRRQGQYANAVQPDLILLDLNLPKKDGREVLAEIKIDERLMKIPVMMMTAEQDPKLSSDSFAAGALVFLPKPFTTIQLQTMLRMLVGKAQS